MCLAEELEPYNIEAFEDPFQYLPGWHQYRDFRRHSRIPLAPHLGDPKMMMSAIRAEAADCFNVGGGVESAQIMAGMAAAAGMPVWLQVVGILRLWTISFYHKNAGNHWNVIH